MSICPYSISLIIKYIQIKARKYEFPSIKINSQDTEKRPLLDTASESGDWPAF